MSEIESYSIIKNNRRICQSKKCGRLSETDAAWSSDASFLQNFGHSGLKIVPANCAFPPATDPDPWHYPVE